MTLFKNLSHKKKKLYRLCYSLGLTEFDWVASQILLDINGYDNAEQYLQKVGKKKCLQD